MIKRAVPAWKLGYYDGKLQRAVKRSTYTSPATLGEQFVSRHVYLYQSGSIVSLVCPFLRVPSLSRLIDSACLFPTLISLRESKQQSLDVLLITRRSSFTHPLPFMTPTRIKSLCCSSFFIYSILPLGTKPPCSMALAKATEHNRDSKDLY